MDEPACVPADREVTAVTAPPVEPGNLEALLRRLFPTAPVPRPILLYCADTATSDWDYGNGNLAAAPASGNAGSGHAVVTGSRSQRLDYDGVFFL